MPVGGAALRSGYRAHHPANSAPRMIAKPYTQHTELRDPRQHAGAEAERQMAHYLHRKFKNDAAAYVLHGLRLEDRAQPEQDGSPGACQIDHLIVHRWGMFIVESKSVTEEVRVRPDGSGGDEWTRVYRGTESGMSSPIQQARRQSEFLRTILRRHAGELLGKVAVGLRTATKFVAGTDQRGFKHAPIQLVIAVSDTGRIRRLDGWQEPRKPFRVFVAKADLVPEKIAHELERHRKGANLLNVRPTGDYGLWGMESSEVERVAGFLAELHVDRSHAAPAGSTRAAVAVPCEPSRDDAPGGHTAKAACKHCGATYRHWGFHYGYFWRCGECGETANMPTVCSSCGTKGRSGKGVRIRKKGKHFFRECDTCGTSEIVWINE